MTLEELRCGEQTVNVVLMSERISRDIAFKTAPHAMFNVEMPHCCNASAAIAHALP